MVEGHTVWRTATIWQSMALHVCIKGPFFQNAKIRRHGMLQVNGSHSSIMNYIFKWFHQVCRPYHSSNYCRPTMNSNKLQNTICVEATVIIKHFYIQPETIIRFVQHCFRIGPRLIWNCFNIVWHNTWYDSPAHATHINCDKRSIFV
jgi:hypothetical protein